MTASVEALANGVTEIKDDVKSIRKEQGEMKEEIQDIKNVPAKQKAKFMDTVGKVIITAVTTGIISFIIGRLSPLLFP